MNAIKRTQSIHCATPPNWGTVAERIRAEEKSQRQIAEIRSSRPQTQHEAHPLGQSHPVILRRAQLDNELIERLGLEGQ